MIDNILFWLSKQVAELLWAVIVIAAVFGLWAGIYIARRIYVNVRYWFACNGNKSKGGKHVAE